MARRIAGIAAVTLSCARAWGPITHSYLACKEVLGGDDAETAACLGGSQPELLVGDGFPDAFVFGSFVVGGNCPAEFGAYHNHAFGSYMLERADKGHSETFDAKAFALGFLAHMTADGIGFYQTGPIVPRNSSYLDWLHVWQYMNSIDAYFASKLALTSAPAPMLSDEGASWVAEAAQGFRQSVDPNVPEISAESVASCAAAWQQVLKDKGEEALRMPADAWQDNLVWFSASGAKTWQQAVADLQPAFGCVESSWEFYKGQVSSGAEPGAFEDSVNKQVEELFKSGACTPSSELTSGPLAAYTEDDFPEDPSFWSAFLSV